MKVVMIYSQYLDREGKSFKIGGVETYLYNLSKIIKSNGLEPIIIQSSDYEFKRKVDGVTIYGVINHKKSLKKLITKAEQIANINEDILIFGASINCKKSNFKKVISIQHGIYWDVDTIRGIHKIPSTISTILRGFQTLTEIKKQKNASTVVCVDNNYVNWYRTQTICRKQNHVVIPNCAFAHDNYISKNKEDRVLRIIYARRFEKIRGTEIIAEVMPKILKRFDNVEFTLAGDGSEAEFLKEKFKKFKNVKFIKYSADESINVHKEYDIAIIPSIASEGTSLSLLEAMYCGCAVVATNVGGITNIILDEYNGLIVNTTVDDVYNAIERLVIDRDLRNRISKKGQETVKYSFCYKKWKEKWEQVINSLIIA